MFQRDKLLRFHHCDPAGIVFYPQILVLLNELVEDWFDEGLGLSFTRLIGERRLGAPVAHLECDFLSPMRMGDRLQLELRVQRVGRSSLTLAVAGGIGERPALRATLVVVLQSLETRRAEPIPADLRGRIERFRVPDPPSM
ncbi:MAG TPA: thioesterase family protein [Anaeromyxobacteraceae bacterium]|jgi:4-hydroxybenzoyl-CoA thioesterase